MIFLSQKHKSEITYTTILIYALLFKNMLMMMTYYIFISHSTLAKINLHLCRLDQNVEENNY